MRSLHATLVLILGDVVHDQLLLFGVGDVGHVVIERKAARAADLRQRDGPDKVPGGVEDLELAVGHAHHDGVARRVEGHPDGALQEVRPVDEQRLDLGLPRPRGGHVDLARAHVRHEDLVVVAGDEADLALARASGAGEELDRVDNVLGALEVDAVKVDLVVLGLRGEQAALRPDRYTY